MKKQSRQLTDHIEKYTEIIHGQCMCGVKVDKVLNSSCTSMTNGDRYHYIDDLSPACIFRCANCYQVISDNFITNPN